jgi:NitT/TauT family transport system permease protein
MNPLADKLLRVILPVLTGLLLIGAWYAIKHYGNLHDLILPAPHDVLAAFYEERDTLFPAAGITLAGAVIGFAGALSLGFAMGLAMAAFKRIRYSLYPFVLFMQMVPILATAAIVVILFDVGLQSVALIAFLIGFFPVVASTLQGLLSVPEGQHEMFRLYQAGPLQELFLLRVPYSLPYVFTGAKIAATLAVIGSVTGEIFAGSSSGAGGLGFMILIYKAELKVSAIYAATLLCCLLGFAFVGLVIGLRQAALRHWHESAMPGPE